MKLKKLLRPKNNKTKETDSIQLWYVRWTSRYGNFFNETESVMEAFTSKEDAEEFAESLKQAFKLIQNTCDDKVTITKN